MNFRSNDNLWSVHGDRLQRLLDSIDSLPADGRPELDWFTEGIRAFDATVTDLAGLGIVTDLVNVRDRNRIMWSEGFGMAPQGPAAPRQQPGQ